MPAKAALQFYGEARTQNAKVSVCLLLHHLHTPILTQTYSSYRYPTPSLGLGCLLKIQEEERAFTRAAIVFERHH